MPPANRGAVIMIAALTVLATAGCTSNTIPAQTPASNGISSLPAQAILKQATDNAKVQTSVHIRGNGTCPQGPFYVDMKLRSDGMGTGTVKFGRAILQVVATPTELYIKSASSFWASETSQKTAALIGSRWLRTIPATNPCLQALGSFTNVLDNYLGYPGAPVKQKSLSVFGVPAQLLTISPDISIWVQTRNVPLPVRVDETASKTGISMGEWGNPVTVQIPAATQTVDSSSIKAN